MAPPPPHPPSLVSRGDGVGEREGRGVRRSKIIRQRENLVLYKTVHTLCSVWCKYTGLLQGIIPAPPSPPTYLMSWQGAFNCACVAHKQRSLTQHINNLSVHCVVEVHNRHLSAQCTGMQLCTGIHSTIQVHFCSALPGFWIIFNFFKRRTESFHCKKKLSFFSDKIYVA